VSAVAAPDTGRLDWTAEQRQAIERRDGDLLLDAAAGSGKTSVLVERFVRAVLEDGVDVAAILTITFTDKAAAELRDRIRARLRELGADDAARATEGAFISTIHGFCARVLRAHALAAGIDPGFSVLDENEARQLAGGAFEEALEDLAQNTSGGVELISAYGAGPLRGAILGAYDELRSRGSSSPRLVAPPPGPGLDEARAELADAAASLERELGAVADPSARAVEALDRLARVGAVIASAEPWPGDLSSLALPGGNGAALSTAACVTYGEALSGFRTASEGRRAERAVALLDQLLLGFGERYAARKRERGGLDFEDLELMTRTLLLRDRELRERYRSRFDQIMVDEFQDTNAVQLELIEQVSADNLFTVGDAQQSIYGFRHADVELFERRGERLAREGRRATLQTNFRARREILKVLNTAFEAELGERFMPLLAGRQDAPAGEPLVELLVADKGADWATEGLAAPWRVAESRALADRVAELVQAGAAFRDIVVLTRATTDLRAYERALEERGVATYLIGGRGYWAHPQVVDLVGYLRALANPRDEEALYTVLASPIVAASLDALVLVGAAARASGRDPWWVLAEPEGRLDDLDAEDRDRLERFVSWFGAERSGSARRGIEELISRALELSGYDVQMLALPGGARRLANVRKLMRLGREFEASGGRDLRGFVDLVRGRSSAWGDPGPGGARESEAPVEGEALDAVRLMTIHRAKGLEFEIVCVADLGRGPWWRAGLLRIGRDGQVGLRLAEPGTAKREPTQQYRRLGDEQAAAEAMEERRVFYVAMTRARERLIVSGAARLEPWPVNGGGGPIGWVAPALVPDIAERAAREDERSGVTPDGVRFAFVAPTDVVVDIVHRIAAQSRPATPAASADSPVVAQAPGPPVPALSYSALEEYGRCGYRFYAERVLGLPGVAELGGAPAAALAAGPPRGLAAAERGILLHALLERLDFRRPLRPTDAAITSAARRSGVAVPVQAAEVADLIDAFAAGEVCARLARATEIRREERFSFLLAGGVLITGALDVVAREPGGRRLVVDYKSDRLEGEEPAAIVARDYATQRLIYALAILRADAVEVEVVHVFLELPRAPVRATYTQADAPRLEQRLAELAAGVLRRQFAVSEAPHRALCGGCPAEGGLCSWPLELTRRDAPDRLF
jgi:ATP-dependent helicase/nuclease subunit A